MGGNAGLEFKANLAMLTVEAFAKYAKATKIASMRAEDVRKDILRCCVEAIDNVPREKHRKALVAAVAAFEGARKPQ
eukprot:8141326-Pyramimonas_sp.AAC.1